MNWESNKFRIMRNKYGYYKVQIYDWINVRVSALLGEKLEMSWQDLGGKIYTDFGDAKARLDFEMAERKRQEETYNDSWEEVNS